MKDDSIKADGASPDYRSRYRGDCENCFGLCCAALPFAASVDFAIDKAAGEPCRNLREDFRCGIHTKLRGSGFRGCTVYDCFGAGQKVSQQTFGGVSWRERPETARAMFAVLPVVWQLHELMVYLEELLGRPAASKLHPRLREELADTRRLTELEPDALLALSVSAQRAKVNELLLEGSELVRAEALRRRAARGEEPSRGAKPARKGGRKGRRPAVGRGADLVGADLRGEDLRAANLRGAYLIAADLRDADLREADLIGADFRDADLRGADLTGALFLTQVQVNAARGDASTILPPGLERPGHWTAAG
ncbi:pentapeptide repeat-containing protein [Saccharibacillus alkalitolerans]|uniref:Pentapeptide repeat-containing protein n=1 Tax=Saccharibacillus alkalitolerans TaxID=2705290 RepID=A0ABX0F6N1_9BACL|nr:pentapeptide repeat-containing protein [Saccharibacillus alkalitolerans]NGZ76427.1 pentapeptide repeat-containing protein [Saccharibacillus alkalitolerans]